LDTALKFFDSWTRADARFEKPDTITYTALMKLAVELNQPQTALRLFKRMAS
jgi:pentatricopeptide repeat protein